MKIYNTLTNKIEPFIPMHEGAVSMYTCGPTVYDVAHIGNARKYTCDDILYRTLSTLYSVNRVMNITDIDDKTIKKGEGKRDKFKEITKLYEEKFFEDLDKLNVKRPDKITRATEYIDKMVAFVEDLLAKGFAYRGEDGSIYFSIEKFDDYGKLSKLDKEGIRAGARVAQDEYDKENPADFALWKAWDENDGEIYWETTLGKGRPGWHLECSTMSMDVLGNTIDIHTGGVDNIFPHHENEIAQSEARSGEKFVNYWVHNEHLLVDDKKMSKSLGNFYRLNDLVEKGFSPLDFRYFVVGAHYRSKLNFTWEGLEAARNARERLCRIVGELGKEKGNIHKKYDDAFFEAIYNDISTPEALAVLWELVRDENVTNPDKLATIAKFDEVLGFELLSTVEIPLEIIEIAEERKQARNDKDFAKSDELRDKIADLGYIIEDKPGNEYVVRKG